MVTLAHKAASQWGASLALQQLIEELPVGLAMLTVEGTVVSLNAAARRYIESANEEQLVAILTRMSKRASQDLLAEAALSLGPLGEVRILMAEASWSPGFVAVLEGNGTARLRSEIQALRAMLAAAASPTPETAASRVLATLAQSLVGSYLAFFELDPATRTLCCTAHARVPSSHQSYLTPKPIHPSASAISRAAATRTPVHLAKMALSPFPVERALEGSDRLSALALPVAGNKDLVGCLFVCGPVGMLGEGEIRLVQGLGDALGALVVRTRQDQALATEREARHALLANLPDAVVEQGPDGRIAFGAGRAEAILGRPAQTLAGLRLADLVQEHDRKALEDLVAEASANGTAVRELVVARPDGTCLTCDVSLHVSSTADGVLLRALFRDVSARKRLEEETRRARAVAFHRERLATVGQLSACVAHEINNPLAFMKSNLMLGLRYLGDIRQKVENVDPELRGAMGELQEMLQECLGGIDRIAAVVQALKGVARQDRATLFHPAQAIHDAVLIFRGAKRSDCLVEVNVPESLPFVQGSPSALAQVILNLMENALDAMGGRGTIQLWADAADEVVQVHVRDCGAGISPEAQAHLFEPFFTTKGEGAGTGLGLYICGELVRQMGGTIRYETGPSGTTFHVKLPVGA